MSWRKKRQRVRWWKLRVHMAKRHSMARHVTTSCCNVQHFSLARASDPQKQTTWSMEPVGLAFTISMFRSQHRPLWSFNEFTNNFNFFRRCFYHRFAFEMFIFKARRYYNVKRVLWTTLSHVSADRSRQHTPIYLAAVRTVSCWSSRKKSHDG